MNVQPFVHDGLGNSSYLLQLSATTCALVDPDRSVDRYLHAAENRGWTIEAVLETHLHADFVSGARELESRTGARIFASSDAELQVPHKGVDDGEKLRLDGAEVEVIRSPGHTPEHVAFVVRRGSGPPALFSGGSLLVGGAARTDLISPALTADLTRQQLWSVRRAFVGLPDETLLLPTHGGGSFCSAGAGGPRQSTLGEERRENPLLRRGPDEITADEFVGMFPAAPDYFFRLRDVNRRGPRLLREISSPRPLDPSEFYEAAPNSVIVDARPQREFMAGHIPGALSNAFRESFVTWIGWLLPPDASILFVPGPEGPEWLVEECLLAGYESFGGYLAGGMDAWQRARLPVANAPLIDAPTAARALRDGAILLDVREESEWGVSHIPGARHIPLGSLARRIGEVPRDRPLIVTCGHGERSATALSILKAHGHHVPSNLDLGLSGWEAAGLPTEGSAPTRYTRRTA
ncbi:MAG TPA: rhodanese-like domain-containing protein [Tepidiformaceae bacterium]|nr:rhodanese-like domain-containing protein [Tepidiformaceae bacterium]